MNVLKIKTTISIVLAILLCSVVLAQSTQARPVDGPPEQEAASASATPTTAQIRDTIKAKCDTALNDKDLKKAHDKESAYKTLIELCKGTGGYKEGASKKAQRAKRLYDLCNNNERYLQEVGAYSTTGTVDSGDCAKIKQNDSLRALTRNLSEYPGGTFGNAEDPALNCAPNESGNEASVSENCDLVKKYIDPFITFLSALVGVAVVIGIISGGIRYTTAGDDPQKVSAARSQIRGALVALLAYMFLWAFIQWVLP